MGGGVGVIDSSNHINSAPIDFSETNLKCLSHLYHLFYFLEKSCDKQEIN